MQHSPSKARGTDLLLAGGRLVFPHAVRTGSVWIRNGRIFSILPGAGAKPPRGFSGQVMDVGGRFIAPGFLDLHINGMARTDAGDPGLFSVLARRLPRHGVVGFLPTVYSLPGRELFARLEAAARACLHPEARCARALGAYAEGPFLSPRSPGSHPPAGLRPPEAEWLRRMWERSAGTLRMITLAPELPGLSAVRAFCARHGIRVALGHTRATYEQAGRAMDSGMRHVTHLFNAMPAFHHRDPGPVAAALERDGVTVELIADGRHVHPAAAGLVIRLLGPDRIALVSDGVPVLAGRGGACRFEGREAVVSRGAVWLKNGTLAGSVTMLDGALGFLAREAKISVSDCVRMVSSTPARVLGLEREFGELRKGAPAYVTVFDDRWRVALTVFPEGIGYRAKIF